MAKLEKPQSKIVKVPFMVMNETIKSTNINDEDEYFDSFDDEDESDEDDLYYGKPSSFADYWCRLEVEEKDGAYKEISDCLGVADCVNILARFNDKDVIQIIADYLMSESGPSVILSQDDLINRFAELVEKNYYQLRKTI